MIALAVSQSDTMELGKVYDAPEGWHWGTRAEVEKLLGGGETVCPPARYYYRDQGGWKNIMWEGVRRSCFVFSDTLEVGGYLRSAGKQGEICPGTAEDIEEVLVEKFFAGIVCVQDGREEEAPVSAEYQISIETSD